MNAPESGIGRFPRLRALIAKHRRDAWGDRSSAITDDDRIRTLEAFIAKVQAGKLTPEEENRAKRLEAIVARHGHERERESTAQNKAA
jgi:hypothetical protein